MRRGYHVHAQPVGRIFQEIIAQFARRLLGAEPVLAGVSAHVAAAHDAGHVPLRAQFLHKALVAVALRAAQAVVKVCRADYEAVFPHGLSAVVQQVYAVRPAGHRAQHALSGQEPVVYRAHSSCLLSKGTKLVYSGSHIM